jgi:hypothetical protein
MKMLMPGKASASHEAAQHAATSELAPGKQTLAQQLPVVELAPEHVAPFKSQHVKDGGGYEYEVTDDGAFSIVVAPESSRAPRGMVITRVKHPEAWRKLATKLLAAPPKLATAASVVTPPPLPAKEAAATVDELLPDFTEGEKRFHGKPKTVEGKSTLEIANTRVAKGDAGTHYSLGASASSLMSGDKDATTFYCSGLQVWTLAAAGYDVDKPILGANGKPYTFTLIEANADAATKEKEPEKKRKVTVNMKKLIDGEPPTVEAMSIAEKNKMTDGGHIGDVYSKELGGKGHKVGWDEDGANHAVRGAARAFELAHIGSEVPELEQKPGDFAQSRHYDTDGGKTEHEGFGHAWQVWSVIAKGRAMFGQAGSPIAVDGKARSGWCDDVDYIIDEHTSPACVGKHAVLKASRLEANIAKAMNEYQAADKKTRATMKGDGGVQITEPRPVPSVDKKSDLHVFYGRLGTSPWSGWHAHEADAPSSADADVDGKLA